MAFEQPLFGITMQAAADLSASQFLFVKADSDGNMVLAGAGDNALGVLQEDVALGYAGNVMVLGISKVVCGGVVTAGSNVSSDAAGKAVNTANTAAAIGIALASGTTGVIVPILLVTRTATGAAMDTILSIPIDLASITTAGDVVTNMVPGVVGTITKAQFIVTKPVTTADKLATLNLEIGTTNVTGGVIALTSANCATLGAVVAGTSITAGNTLAVDSQLSVEAASVTAFSEGEGVLVLTIR